MTTETHIYPVSEKLKKSAWIDNDKYQTMYDKSQNDPEGFWAEEGKRIDWIKPYSTVKNTSFAYPDVSIKWYEDGI